MSAVDWSSEEVQDRIDDFLDTLLDKADFDLDYEIVEGGGDVWELITPELTVEFSGDDVELLLENRADLLLALEQLTLEALRVPHEDRFKIVFDAEDYRLLRIEELKLSAEAAAEKVVRTGRPFHFQPMTSRERRIIHLVLNDNPKVTTGSEGMAPRRHTVIYPAK